MTAYENRFVVLADRADIEPREEFTLNGVRYRAITGSVGLKREIMPGVFVSAGMVNDPEYPLPDNAVTVEVIDGG